MKIFPLLFAFLFAPLSNLAAAETTTIYLIRHANRLNQSDDSPINEEGEKLARAWATKIKDFPITTVFVSGKQRTQQTAAPFVTARPGVEVVQENNVRKILRKIEQRAGKTLLVVGHSETLPKMIGALVPAQKDKIKIAEYDRFFTIVLSPPDQPSFKEVRYQDLK